MGMQVDWQAHYRSLSDAELRVEAQNQSASAEARAALSDELRRRAAAITTDDEDPAYQEVVVTDIDMPFFSMVGFMVKWTIASIPALIILTIIAFLMVGFLAALGMGFR